MSVRNITLIQLLLCGLLTLTGCKSPSWSRFADNRATVPEATVPGTPDTQIAATASDLPAGSAAEETFSVRKAWRKAGGWLTLRRAPETFAQEESGRNRRLDRQLSRTSVQTPDLALSRPDQRPLAGASERELAQPSDTADTEPQSKSTPSLVRRSRRPPPDPAPKLQQEQLFAGDVGISNPYVQTDSPAVTAPVTDGSVYRAIASASCSWRNLMSSDRSLVAQETLAAQEATDPERPTSANEGLKFVPPNIDKRRATSDVVASTFSTNNGSDRTVDVARQTDEQAETIPSRKALLANHDARSPVSSAPSAKKNQPGKQVAAAKRSATTPDTRWIAKKTEPTGEPSRPATASSETAAKRQSSRSVVADTFAANTFSSQQTPGSAASPPEQTSVSSKISKQQASAFPLPQGGTKPRSAMASNPHVDGYGPDARPTNPAVHRPLLAASSTPPTVPSQVPLDKSIDRSSPDVERVAAIPAAESPVERMSRATLLPKPVPASPPSLGYSSYYYRGLLPNKFSLARTPSDATPTVSTEVEELIVDAPSPTETLPPTATLAPLVDAETYRQRQTAAPSVPPRVRPMASQSTSASPTGNTWLAAYQKLVGNGPQRPVSPPVPATASRRNLSSDDSSP